jgi:hypothetical protein
LDAQVVVVQIQDRLGCLFMDYKGSSSLCFMFGLVKLLHLAVRGVLLGLFIGGWACAEPCKH